MSSEDKFWLGIWLGICTVIIVLTLSVSYYHVNHDDSVVRALEAGVNPMQNRLCL